jgi:hypothetical protein
MTTPAILLVDDNAVRRMLKNVSAHAPSVSICSALLVSKDEATIRPLSDSYGNSPSQQRYAAKSALLRCCSTDESSEPQLSISGSVKKLGRSWRRCGTAHQTELA